MTRLGGGPAPAVNVLRDGADHGAETVKVRLLAKQCSLDVYVDEAGNLRTERAGDECRRKEPFPDRWHVGRYTRKASVADIETDLRMRLMEIPQ